MPEDKTYRFPSLAPFIDDALDSANVENPEWRLMARDGVHAARITDALSQLEHQAREQAAGRFPKGTVKSVFGYIQGLRDSLAAQLSGIDKAIAEAKKSAGTLATESEPVDQSTANPVAAPVNPDARPAYKPTPTPTPQPKPAANPGAQPASAPTTAPAPAADVAKVVKAAEAAVTTTAPAAKAEK